MSSDSREPPGEPPRKRPRRAIAEPSLSSDTQDNTSVSSKSVFSLFSELSQQESETPLDTEWESSSESVSEGENSTGEDTDLKDALKRKTKTPATDPPDSAFNRMMNTAKTKDKSPKPTKPEYPKRLKDLPAKGIDTSLPPLSGTREIFSDITKTALKNGLTPILNKLQGRPIRVATLCSGTESPLLALNMIQGCLQELIGKSFTVEHVFSAEIEGWKQAYIERNFHPPYIFRDVVELLEAGKDDFKA